MSEFPKLSEAEQMCMKAWKKADEDFSYLPFHAIARDSGLARENVRRTVRALARKGMLKYLKGLWTDDGEMAGAGYGPTDLGWAYVNCILRKAPKPVEEVVG